MPADKKIPDGNLKPPPPTSDAVAVALAREYPTDRAPKVVAGGRGQVAEQILQIAFQNGIKVREDANLAQLLTAIDIDSEIPLEAFAAVAEILIYVYQANEGQSIKEFGGQPTGTIQELVLEMAKKWKDTGSSS